MPVPRAFGGLLAIVELDMIPNENLLKLDGVEKHFVISRGFPARSETKVKAVDGVSFSVRRGETFGLVGESGCGKTTLGRCILQLAPLTSGTIRFEGKEMSYVKKTRPKSLSAKMQAIFQDPYSSLNPRHKVKRIILEPLVIQGTYSKDEMDERLRESYRMVGLEEDMGERYPHMLSGGQQQRVSIARAMIIQPSFVVCDEPVSSLDVSISAQIINLLKSLQEKLNVTYLFISHDLSVVQYISNVVAVMYLGRIVEICAKSDLYSNPLHPYTQALISAVPIPDPLIEKKRHRVLLRGEVPSAISPPPGCPFHPRCERAIPHCAEALPLLREVAPEHRAACFLV